MSRLSSARLSLAALAAALGAGCAIEVGEPVVGTVPVREIEPEIRALTGVAVDPRLGTLVLAAPGVGLVEVTPGGSHLRTMREGDWGLDVRDIEDVAVLDGDRFLLAAQRGVVRYDALSSSLEELPCRAEPLVPLDVKNRAVAIDEERQEVLVAPALYPFTDEAEPEPVETLHLRCALGDGVPHDRRDVRESGVVAQGIAFDAEVGRIYAVSGQDVHLFDEDSRWLGSMVLDGVEDATGVAFDDMLNTLYVSDGARLEVHAFPLDALRGARVRVP